MVLLGVATDVPQNFDVVVYGATPGGIMAAIAARRTGTTLARRHRTHNGSGLSVALIANGTHIGGFTSGGHCGNDMYKDWVLFVKSSLSHLLLTAV